MATAVNFDGDRRKTFLFNQSLGDLRTRMIEIVRPMRCLAKQNEGGVTDGNPNHEACAKSKLLTPRLLEQAVYFFIRSLREVLVPAPHAHEWFRRLAADDFVDLRPELFTCLRRSDGNGYYQSRGLLFA